MPDATAKYPAALVTLADLGGEYSGIGENEWTSASAVTSGAAVPFSLIVNETIAARVPAAGWLTTANNEILHYSAVNTGTKTFTVDLRAQQDTTAAAIDVGSAVGQWLTKRAVNQLLAEVIALQTRLGIDLPGPQSGLHSFRYEPLGTNGINVVNIGSGTTAGFAAGRGQLMSTGATNPSSTSQRIVLTGSGTVLSRIQRVRRIEFQAYIADVLASANSYLYITTESADTAPSALMRHLGIKNLNGTVSFTTADGNTEQTTAITSFVTAAQVHAFVITFDGTTAKLYIDGTLRATHATNVPTADTTSATFRAFIDNNASVNVRLMAFLSCDVIFASA